MSSLRRVDLLMIRQPFSERQVGPPRLMRSREIEDGLRLVALEIIGQAYL